MCQKFVLDLFGQIVEFRIKLIVKPNNPVLFQYDLKNICFEEHNNKMEQGLCQVVSSRRLVVKVESLDCLHSLFAELPRP